MKTNNVRAAWREGKAVASAWLHIPTAYTAEICAGAGFDVITIDMQHGPVDYQSAVDMMIALNGSNVTPFVRVPWLFLAACVDRPLRNLAVPSASPLD